MPDVIAGSSEERPSVSEPFASPRYLLRRKVLSFIGAKFHIYDHAGNLAFFARMKGFKLKEDLRLYADESMDRELLTITTRHVIDFSAGYDVYDPVAAQPVGSLKRKGFKSMLRDEWVIHDARGEPIGLIQEDGTALALARRFIDAIAFLFPQKYHADINGQTVATFQQNFNPFVHKLDIDFTPDTDRRLDPRLGLAAAAILAAIEQRQT